MTRMFFLAYLLVFSVQTSAGAIWTDYQMKIDPKNESKVKSLMENYMDTDAGESFPGLWIYNGVVANGSQQTTHNFALVYQNEQQWEERRSFAANDKNAQRMMGQLNSLAEMVSETVYEHVAGYGLPAEDTKQWIGIAAHVKDESQYLAIVDGIMDRTEPAFSIDFWAVRAGGAPGVTHVITIGVESRAAYNADPEVRKLLAEVGQAASDVRTVVGVDYVDTILIMGPLNSADIR